MTQEKFTKNDQKFRKKWGKWITYKSNLSQYVEILSNSSHTPMILTKHVLKFTWTSMHKNQYPLQLFYGTILAHEQPQCLRVNFDISFECLVFPCVVTFHSSRNKPRKWSMQVVHYKFLTNDCCPIASSLFE